MGSISPLPNPEAHLHRPWHAETILQIRTGPIKTPFKTTPETSAIYKSPHTAPIFLSKAGLTADEHAYADHNHPDRALHQYSALHYASWKAELPHVRRLFENGAFGENIITDGRMNEWNVCVGDVVSIGETVRVQVSMPRMPCYKLNLRFQVGDMAARTQKTKRTGWMYRVLKEGWIGVGDQVRLVERRLPGWSLGRVQTYLHDVRGDRLAMEELVGIEELGEEIRGVFRESLRQGVESEEGRLGGGVKGEWSECVVLEKVRESRDVFRMVFERVEKEDEPKEVQSGSHVRLRLANGMTRAYSVISGTSNHFELGVALNHESRGGSKYIHDTLKSGDVLSTSEIIASFPLIPDAENHIMIAGGIRITAFLSAAKQLQENGGKYHLHYLVRSTEDIAFNDRLKALGENITIWDKSTGKPFDAPSIFRTITPKTHIYTCGSTRLTTAIKALATTHSFPLSNLHFESFSAPESSAEAFEVEIASSKQVLKVEGGESLLDVLRNAGFDVASGCEVGSCGTCKVGVRAGKVCEVGRGTGLPFGEREGGMLSCVERGWGGWFWGCDGGEIGMSRMECRAFRLGQVLAFTWMCS
ncbi:PK beta-barrel [Glarea lozoyensis ATCC 20868]|uniref:PK beta-barrel n=1 Tax=Glarea lozoyensis (strain ATCC 20868 / MF5171) TaxID=1116229 RepID=S3CT28_GLAL2|nr:PK beta-barrel [Glarea lozoyensis ATCC 20868]EPE28780.1 PK beta-barrel [Glarea lozoyensis ATCC 20868]